MTDPIKVGDKVRSFDFEDHSLEGDRACYIEGTITGIGRFNFPDCNRYEIEVSKRVFGGKELEIDPDNRMVYPPVNGTPTLMGKVTAGVVKIDTVKETLLQSYIEKFKLVAVTHKKDDPLWKEVETQAATLSVETLEQLNSIMDSLLKPNPFITCTNCHKEVLDNPVDTEEGADGYQTIYYCPHCEQHFPIYEEDI